MSEPVPARLLLVTAHDANLTAGLMRAVRRAHELGLLTAASIAVTRPLAACDGDWLRSAPRLSVGLALDLAAVKRAADVPAAIDAQYERFLALLGRAPTHLDADLDPSCAGALGAAIERARALGVPFAARDEGATLLVQAAGLAAPQAHFHGQRGRIHWTRERLRTSLTDLAPGISAFSVSATADSAVQCEEELRWLADPEVRALQRAQGIQLIGWEHLAQMDAQTGRSTRTSAAAGIASRM